MKYFLVVFFLFDGQWIEGDPAEGWGPYPYATESACLIAKQRSEEIFTIGLSGTKESDLGFPFSPFCAIQCDAHRNILHRLRRRSLSA